MTSPTLEDLHIEQNNIMANTPIIPQYKPGRSIVTTSYRAEIPGTFILLSELRRLDMNLPIEVFYRDDELNSDEITEMSNIWPGHIVFKKLQRKVEDFVDRWGNKKGWGSKVIAVLESEFSENFWIDCDNVPIRNCVDLFDDEEYVAKGSLFWRDVYSVDRADTYCSTSPLWRIFDVSYNDAEPFESGQFLVNKNVVWPQLSLMAYFTERNDIYYQFGGDAECWRMAWQLYSIKNNRYHSQVNYNSGKDVPYGFIPYGPFHKGVPNPWGKYGGGTVMVQRDRRGRELFNHRNIYKWKWHEENPFNEDVTNESSYHMIMNHIKSKYNVK